MLTSDDYQTEIGSLAEIKCELAENQALIEELEGQNEKLRAYAYGLYSDYVKLRSTIEELLKVVDEIPRTIALPPDDIQKG